jgi:hypothetical protein
MRKRFAEIQQAREAAHTLRCALVKEFEIAPTPLPIEAFAHRLGVGLVEARLDGASAQLVVGQQRARILLSERLTGPDVRRWVIAHELGHFVLRHRARPIAELCAPHGVHMSATEDAADIFASSVLMPAPVVALFCDRAPMTLEVVQQLAQASGVPLVASALRIMESSWQVCAFVFSQYGRIRWIYPSLPFLMLCGPRLCSERAVGPGALARRFFDRGHCPEEPRLVPASAWIDDCSCPDAQIMEQSVALGQDTVMSVLWYPANAREERPAMVTLPYVTATRDYLLTALTVQRRSKA